MSVLPHLLALDTTFSFVLLSGRIQWQRFPVGPTFLSDYQPIIGFGRILAIHGATLTRGDVISRQEPTRQLYNFCN